MTARDHAFSEPECWELLAMASVGRLALSVRALPVILPVQYYLDGHRLAVCLGHHALPEQALNDTIVAFAADSIDPVTRSGWSVQVQGKSVIPCGLRIDTECGWPAAAQVVEIEPGRISGLRIHLCSFIDALLSAGPEAADPMRAASWASGQRVTRPPRRRCPASGTGRHDRGSRGWCHPVAGALR